MNRFFLLMLALCNGLALYSQSILNQDYVLHYNTKIEVLEFTNVVSESFYLTKNWVFIDKKSDTPEKLKFLDIWTNVFPQKLASLNRISEYQDENFKEHYLIIAEKANDLLTKEYGITQKFKTFNSYDDPLVVFETIPLLEEGGEICRLKDEVLDELTKLLTDIDNTIVALTNKVDLKDALSPKLRDIYALIDLLNVENQARQMNPTISEGQIQAIHKALVKSYDKNFTHAEIKDLIEFYKSKTGQKMIKKSPDFMIDVLKDLTKKQNS